MRVIRVGDRADLVGLARSVLPPDADAAAVERTMAAIKAANPGVDVDRLAPGSFVQVPTFDGDDAGRAQAAGDVSSGPLQSLRGILDAAIAELRGLADQPASSTADRRLIQVALKDDAVLKAGGEDEVLGDVLESVAAQLQTDRQDGRDRVEQVDAIAAQWIAQLEFLAARSVPDR